MNVSHGFLVQIAASWLRKTRRCHIVLTERGSREIPDAIGWAGSGESLVVECKVSLADLDADKEKPFRQGNLGMGQTRWYLTPAGLLTGRRPAWYWPWGLLEWDGSQCRVKQKAQRLDANMEAERRLLLNELRAYHAQGITYKRGAERWGPRPMEEGKQRA